MPIKKIVLNKPYDAPFLIIESEKMRNLVTDSIDFQLLGARELLEKMKIEVNINEEENEFEVDIPKEKIGIFNAFSTTKVFEQLEHQNQYSKINFIVLDDDEILRNVVKKEYATMKLMAELDKKTIKNITKEDIKKLEQTTISSAVEKSLRNTDFYKKSAEKSMHHVKNANSFEEGQQMILLETYLLMYKSNITENDLFNMMISSYARYEIDFKNKEMNVYFGSAKKGNLKPENFAPWKDKVEELHVHNHKFARLKIYQVKRMLENAENVDIAAMEITENVLKEQGIENKIENGKFLSIPETADLIRTGKPEYENYIAHLMEEQIYRSKILAIASYILTNNIIVKTKESKREYVQRKNPKKGKKTAPKFKSIVREYYKLDAEKEESVKKQILNDMKVHRERTKDIAYSLEEWEVKPHTRTLKSGKVIHISAGKRKRKEELLKTGNKKPMVLSNRDLKKMKQNSIEKKQS